MNKVGRNWALAKEVFMEEGHAFLPDSHVEQADVSFSYGTSNRRVKLEVVPGADKSGFWEIQTLLGRESLLAERGGSRSLHVAKRPWVWGIE
jgi:hypothetical protein